MGEAGGPPRWVLEASLLLHQVVKWYVKRRVASVEHRVLRGTEAAIATVLAATHNGTLDALLEAIALLQDLNTSHHRFRWYDEPFATT